ncbi:MAG: class I SAM-dependent methyltransferase [Bacteriovoracaceae bacterium]
MRALTQKILPPFLYQFVVFLWDRLNRFRFPYSQALKVYSFYNESRWKGIEKSESLDFLKALNSFFPLEKPKGEYQSEKLLARGAFRLNELQKMGFDFKGKAIADVGAGCGEILLASRDFGFQSAMGLDYSAQKYRDQVQALNLENKLSHAKYIEADLGDGFGDDESLKEKFDYVVSYNAFEHFHKPEVVLESMVKILKPGGTLHAHFGPLFLSPQGAHRYGYSSIPYIQNAFKDPTAFQFFYEELKINEGVNRYTGEKITNGDPYSEMNKFDVKYFVDLFSDHMEWEDIKIQRRYDYRYWWFTKVFKKELSHISKEDLFTSALIFTLKKPLS